MLIVYDSDESLIVKACGRTPPVPITSSSNSLRIVFKTDGSRNATGFKATWFTDTVINSIKSPNYPLLYPINADQVKLSSSAPPPSLTPSHDQVWFMSNL